MNCCEHHKINCRQGRDCPARTGTHKPRYTKAPRYKYDKALGIATAIIVGIVFGGMLAWGF